jgi:XTP/dITP diphosphohydrolase
MTALLLATRNAHKALEIQQILGADFKYLTLRDFPGEPLVVEDGDTFSANAAKKADALAAWLSAHPKLALDRLPSAETPICVVADDSGLEVDGLGGAPGVHSARFAAMDVGGAGNSPDAANNAKLLRLLEKVPPSGRTARFRCVLAVRKLLYAASARKLLVLPSPSALQFEGACEGRISARPSGQGGFGYDPLFIPEGFIQSFAELGDEAKNTLSHRALALQKLRQFLAPNRHFS